MRELNLYQTEQDEVLLVTEALHQACWLVPDTHNKSPEVRRLTALDEFQSARLETRHFYIFNAPTEESGLSVRKVIKDNNEFYYVSPGVGIPSLEFLGGGVLSDQTGRGRLIRPGFLAYSPEYWAADLSRKLATPPKLASLFEHLSKIVKGHSSKIKLGKNVFWVGKGARSELEKSGRLVGYENLDYNGLAGQFGTDKSGTDG
jgi:hypothetical protein